MASALEGKITVITGASRGIGRALALGFAQEGATVVATARTQVPGPGTPEGSLEETVRQIADAGGRGLAIPCDVSKEDSVKALVERTLAEVGPIDVLVNNAATLVFGPITEFDTADWDMVMATNVRGPFLLCKHTLPGMMERRKGNVLNITSGAARADTPKSPVYGSSKAALERFSLNVAAEMKPYDIAVNLLGPGVVDTAMSRSIGMTVDRLGRPAVAPEEVVAPAIWLAQQDASSFTGRLVNRNDYGDTWP